MKKDIVPSRQPEAGLSPRDQIRVAFAGAVIGLVAGGILWLLSGSEAWFVGAPVGGAFGAWLLTGEPPLIIR